jgi:hypothetical protein
VVYRLVAGGADEGVSADLRRLGVSYLWLSGAEPELVLGISNTPGLSMAVSDGLMTVWPVLNPVPPPEPPSSAPDPLWAWVSLIGLALLVALALPQVRARADASRPRRGGTR